MTLEILKTLLRTGIFAGFVAIGLLAMWNAGRLHKTLVRVLIAYVIAVSLAVGFTQIEAWPFTHWALVHTLRDPAMDRWDLVGVDATGRDFLIDPRVFEPFAFEEFHTWLRIYFFKLDADGRQKVAGFMIRRAEAARRRFMATGRVGAIDRILGPLTAPRHFCRARVWRTPADLPRTPFVRLKILLTSWNIEEAEARPSAVKHEVLFESQ
ncbi:MAG TPA: hypothetical protein VLV78_15765 [Thermoanaerobaculia bacterium]|nr:hypothetical protein [Thermoanaerobaculia bacterium]